MLPEMTPKEIQDATESQADFAIQAANLLLFVVDGREGLLPLDESLAAKFRKMGKSPVLVVNKIDEPEKNYSSSEFGKLGFKNVVSVSAELGHGVEKLSSLLLSLLPDPAPYLPDESEEPRTRIAFIGHQMWGNPYM